MVEILLFLCLFLLLFCSSFQNRFKLLLEEHAKVGWVWCVVTWLGGIHSVWVSVCVCLSLCLCICLSLFISFCLSPVYACSIPMISTAMRDRQSRAIVEKLWADWSSVADDRFEERVVDWYSLFIPFVPVRAISEAVWHQPKSAKIGQKNTARIVRSSSFQRYHFQMALADKHSDMHFRAACLGVFELL